MLFRSLNYYDKGLKAFEDGDLEKAQEYYEQALEFGSWLGWTKRDLPPYKNSSVTEQKLRSLIRNIIKEELNRGDYMQALYALEKPHLSDKDAIQNIVSIYNSHIQQLSSLQGNLNEYGEDSGGQDMTYGMYSRSSTRKDQGNQDFIDKGKYDFYDDVPFEACPYEDGFNKYYNADLAKLWQIGWKEAKAEDEEELGESYDYETQKDLAQLIRGAYQIEPQSMKYTLDIMKSPNINVTNAGEIVTNYFKNKNITDSDIISSTMDKV